MSLLTNPTRVVFNTAKALFLLGLFLFSNPSTINANPLVSCDAEAGTLNPVSNTCISGNAILVASTETPSVVPAGFEVLYVLTTGDDLTIIDAGAEPNFSVNQPGEYRIHTLVYDPSSFLLNLVQFGITTGVSIFDFLQLGIVCGSLDPVGAFFDVGICPCPADAGTLFAESTGCLDGGTADLQAGISTSPTVPAEFETLYVLTRGPGLVIEGVNVDPNFTVSEIGDYRIHTLVYNPITLDLSIVEPGVTTGFDVNGLLQQGGGTICASLDVAGAVFHVTDCGCTADAGTLTAISDDCLDGSAELKAEINQAPEVPAGYEVLYVLTSGAGLVIENVSADPNFTVNETGTYTIHTLVYDPATLDLSIVEIGVTTGFDVNGLLQQGGGDICASLDVAGAAFEVEECPCEANAGTLSGSNTCIEGSLAGISASGAGDIVVPTGYEVLYVLTSGDDLVIENVNADPSFVVPTDGSYTIHTLVYDPVTLDLSIVEIGVTTGFDVNGLLIQGGGDICASLDVAGAQFSFGGCTDFCLSDAGTLTAASDNCLDGTAELVAAVDQAPNVPSGYEVLYVLTSGADLVIQNVNADPTFTVDAPGTYTIHTLVYDPATLDLTIVEIGTTTGVDVNGLLQQGGGDICASLDVAGAAFEVEECPCAADAGTLTADSDNCLEDGAAELIAAVDQAPNVPAGYEVLYVLTSGADLVIQNVSADPVFTVDAEGTYTIHTLVYDPNTLDLTIVEIGVATGVDVNGLLIQGGGDICASLDVAGAPFDVVECPCLADAGTLTADSDNCLEDGAAELIAAVDQAPNVPAGYEVLYVLTSGADLVIQNVSADPVFTVDAEGTYTIHTLVYDPNTLDLTIVEIGVTTGVDVNGLLIQGGGDICASLDVAGAPFDVVECPCLADAGTLAVASDNCLDGTADLIASVDQAPTVPAGFEVLYVLTSGAGLVIENVNADPEFTVDAEGIYTIHTLVYDPNTLDLTIVEIGVTTGFDVNGLLIQGGGDICASLDVAGAPFDVIECNNLFPNPTQGRLNIEIPNRGVGAAIMIQVNDLNGNAMKTIELASANEIENINIEELFAGRYSLTVQLANGDVLISETFIKI